ncbi:MAG: hypothetical protein LQ340_006655 [Diploschistes diacapsis]|nr:MAG: hypothetical protein LQ340_006655 [Diploschistes diacapsis]
MSQLHNFNVEDGDRGSFARFVSKVVLVARNLRTTNVKLIIVRAVLQTGLTPSASGSAYLELEQQPPGQRDSALLSTTPALKLTCTVHGPRPLPRSAPFTPNMLLSTTVKFAPFASHQRRGYLRDAAERDLAVHLETALRGVIIAERWPKSGIDVVVTVLEGEEDTWWGDIGTSRTPLGMMTVLAGCITAASTAIVDAGIDCVDIVSGGVAAVVSDSESEQEMSTTATSTYGQLVLDPCPLEHKQTLAACVVAYQKERDEVTEVWVQGRLPLSTQPGMSSEPEAARLVDGAVQAATAVRTVICEALKESQ